MNILVTGGNGQLGSEIRQRSTAEHHWFFTDSNDLDITNCDAVEQFFTQNSINLCLNCAAYTAVDQAEELKEICEKVNVDGVVYLAQACSKNNAVLVHISTDYVFDGTHFQPYQEDDAISPVNFYGETKAKSEEKALSLNSKTFIIRTSWVYSKYGKNFVKTMQKLGNERDCLNVIFDQIGTPTYAGDLADAILAITIAKERTEYGIYHFSNQGVTSWYDFAKAIFELSEISCELKPIETKDYPTTAKRPYYSLLNKAKFVSVFNYTIPYWRDSLKTCLAEMKNN